MKKTSRQLVYILKSAIRGEKVEIQSDYDLKKILRLADAHSVIPYLYTSLIKCGCKEIEKFSKQIERGIAVSEMQKYYVATVSEKMSAHAIKHVFLKGQDVAKFMPDGVMRFSCDIDVFCEEKDGKKIRKVMQEAGLELTEKSKPHDTYCASPFISVEVHHSPSVYKGRAFEDFSRLIKVDGSRYQMSDEDILVYQVVHLAKHFVASGVGLRAIIDFYLTKKSVQDTPYIRETLKNEGLLDFYESICGLTETLFEERETDEFYDCLLEFIINSATYGSAYNRNLIINRTDDKSNKIKRFFIRAFPPFGEMAVLYPWLKKFPIALPFLWVWRLMRALVVKPKSVNNEMKNLSAIDEKTIRKNREMFKRLNLE